MIPSNVFHTGRNTTTNPGMAMTIEQHLRFGEIALAAMITQHDSIMLTPDELSQKVWAIADAMTSTYIQQNGNR